MSDRHKIQIGPNQYWVRVREGVREVLFDGEWISAEEFVAELSFRGESWMLSQLVKLGEKVTREKGGMN